MLQRASSPVLARREQLIVLGGLTVITLAFAVTKIIRPAVRSVAERASQSSQERAILTRERQMLSERARMDSVLRTLTLAFGEIRDRIIVARTSSTAAMSLATYLRENAQDSGLRAIRCLDLGADSLSGPVRRLRVQMEAQGSFDQVVSFLKTMESGTLRVSIADLELVGDNATASASRSASAPETVLHFRMVGAAGSLIENGVK